MSIAEYWKVIAGILAIGAVFISFDDYMEDNKRETISTVKAYSDTTSFLINRLESSIWNQQRQFEDVDRKLDIIQNNYSNHLNTDKKYEQLFKLQQDLLNEVKKNESYIKPIVQK